MDAHELAESAGFEWMELSESERKLVSRFAGAGQEDGPAPGSTVRGPLVSALATADAVPLLHRRAGLAVAHVTITDRLDLSWRTLEGPLRLEHCTFEERPAFTGTSFVVVDLSHGTMPGLAMDKCHGGDLRIEHATVEGKLELAGGRFGHLALNSTVVRCDRGDVAIDGNVISLERSASLAKLDVVGSIRFIGAHVDGQFVLREAHLDNGGSERPCLTMHEATVARLMSLRNATCVGYVNLSGATFGRFVARNATFCNSGRRALNLKATMITRSARFDNAVLQGYAELTRLNVGSYLRLAGVCVAWGETGSGSAALPEDDDGDEGAVDIEPGDKTAVLRLERIRAADVQLGPGLTVLGKLTMAAATVRGDVDAGGATFDGGSGIAFDGSGMSVDGSLRWSPSSVTGTVDLSRSSVGTLIDAPGAWPGKSELVGLRYGSITTSGWRLQERLRWLDSQESFSPQPYEQLARALEAQGHASDARDVLIARESARRTRGGLGPLARVANKFLEVTVKHGYAPHRALAWLLLAAGLGAWALYLAWGAGAVVSSDGNAVVGDRCPPAGVCYSPVVYSLDLLLPIIDFRQEGAWRIQSDVPWGWSFELVGWLLIAAGWALTTAVVAGVTRVVQRK